MTIAAVAASKAFGGDGTGRRLAAPGAVLMTAGLVILWWGLGIFRGETGAAMGGSSVLGSATPIGQFDPRNLGGTPGGHQKRAS